MNNPCTIKLDNVSFRLKERHDFGWLKELGEVFCVFAEQDSGNISFGVESEEGKKFVKYAGAKTLQYPGEPEDAIERLKSSAPVFETLRHPHLVNLTTHFDVAGGCALVFDWFDGENLYSRGASASPFKPEHSYLPIFRFKQLPVEQRLAVLKSIFEFHIHVEKKGYVAVDFYDGSILFDFKNNVTKICDIDLYRKKPFVNSMGRLWGSARFMAPEEFDFGAEIDERTNVFNMGATAFCLLGGGRDRSLPEWEAGRELRQVAMRAVEKEKKDRYSTVEEFASAWESAAKAYKES